MAGEVPSTFRENSSRARRLSSGATAEVKIDHGDEAQRSTIERWEPEERATLARALRLFTGDSERPPTMHAGGHPPPRAFHDVSGLPQLHTGALRGVTCIPPRNRRRADRARHLRAHLTHRSPGPALGLSSRFQARPTPRGHTHGRHGGSLPAGSSRPQTCLTSPRSSRNAGAARCDPNAPSRRRRKIPPADPVHLRARRAHRGRTRTPTPRRREKARRSTTPRARRGRRHRRPAPCIPARPNGRDRGASTTATSTKSSSRRCHTTSPTGSTSTSRNDSTTSASQSPP